MTKVDFLVVLAVIGAVPIAAVLGVRWRNQQTWQRNLVAYRLSFPRGLDAAAVTAFVAGLSGLVAERLRQPFVVRAVVFETTATRRGISHRMLVPEKQASVVLAALRAALPGVGVQVDEEYRARVPTVAAELGLSTSGRMLAVDRAEAVSTAILASLQPLDRDEQITVQWAASPVGPVEVVNKSAARLLVGSMWQSLTGTMPTEPDPADVKAAREKQASPLFAVNGRIGVRAPQRGRAHRLLGGVLAALHVANAPGVHLRRRRLPMTLVAKRMTRHALPLVTAPCVFNSQELGALVAFPLGDVALPGLRLGGCRQLAPAADIPARGRVVCQASFPGAERPMALSVKDSLRHLHVIGPTGSGKSTLLVGLIEQDMRAGHGVVVLEPKGDLVADVLDRVPEHRLDDVILLDPMDDRPVGLNLLACTAADRELVVDQIAGIFASLFKAGWGARTDDILRAALLTLAGVPGMTLTEIPLLLTDSGFRRGLVGRVDDPILQQFWGWFEGMSDGERTQAIAPLSNKLRAVLLRRRLRNVLGQAEPRLDLDWALAHKKILLVPLAKGQLGEAAAGLMGSLVVARVWQAIQRRTSIPGGERPMTFAYIDEFQDYLNLPTSVEDVLAQARGLGMGLTLAHQHLGQLPGGLKEAILANARSRVIFQVTATDARALAREVTPCLTAEDLQGLNAYEVVATLSAGARIAPPATGRTVLPPEPTGLGEIARARSRERYGQDRDEVEAAIRARHDGQPVRGGIGRREVLP